MSHLILDTLATVPDLVAFAAHGVALAADNTPAANPDGSVAGSPGIGVSLRLRRYPSSSLFLVST